jgi:hypothetical protein
LALVQQNLVAELYLPQNPTGANVELPDHVKADVEAAKIVGRRVLETLNLTDREAQEIVEMAGVEWDQAGETLVTVASLSLPGPDLHYRWYFLYYKHIVSCALVCVLILGKDFSKEASGLGRLRELRSEEKEASVDFSICDARSSSSP